MLPTGLRPTSGSSCAGPDRLSCSEEHRMRRAALRRRPARRAASLLAGASVATWLGPAPRTGAWAATAPAMTGVVAEESTGPLGVLAAVVVLVVTGAGALAL